LAQIFGPDTRQYQSTEYCHRGVCHRTRYTTTYR